MACLLLSRVMLTPPKEYTWRLLLNLPTFGKNSKPLSMPKLSTRSLRVASNSVDLAVPVPLAASFLLASSSALDGSYREMSSPDTAAFIITRQSLKESLTTSCASRSSPKQAFQPSYHSATSPKSGLARSHAYSARRSFGKKCLERSAHRARVGTQ